MGDGTHETDTDQRKPPWRQALDQFVVELDDPQEPLLMNSRREGVVVG